MRRGSAAGLAALAFGVAADQALGRQFGRGRRRVRPELMRLHDEVLEVLPRTEEVVDRQDVQVQEELAAAAEAFADQAVVFLGEIQDGVRQEREDVKRGQRVGQVFLAVPEVVLKMAALGLEHVVVAVLDSPAGTSAGGQLHRVFRIDVQVGRPAVAVGLPPLGVRHGQFDPVRPERAVLTRQGDALREADGPRPPVPVVVPARLADGPEVARLEDVQPLVRRPVGLPEAGEDEVQSVEQDFAAERPVRIQVVAEQDGAGLAQPGRHVVQPALGGVDLAVLLFRAVLRRDEFGAQGDGLPDAGRHDHGRDRLVAEDRPAVPVARDEAVRARDLLRAAEVRPVEGDERAAPEDAVALQRAAALQKPQKPAEGAVQQFRGGGVQQASDAVVRRDVPDAEKRQRVAPALFVLHGPLAGQPRRGLEEEHGEGGHHRVRDGVAGVASLPDVGESRRRLPDETDAPRTGGPGPAGRPVRGRPHSGASRKSDRFRAVTSRTMARSRLPCATPASARAADAAGM